MTTSRRLLALALAVAVCHVALPPFGAAAAGSRASAAKISEAQLDQEDREFSFSADASDSFEPAAFKREREERLARADAFAGSRFAAAAESSDDTGACMAWKEVTASGDARPGSRQGYSGFTLSMEPGDPLLVLVGGLKEDANGLGEGVWDRDEVHTLNLKTNTWGRATVSGTLARRVGPASAWVPARAGTGGRMVVFSGISGDRSELLSDLAVLEVSVQALVPAFTWKAADVADGPKPSGRQAAAMTALPDGRVLMYGGYDDAGAKADAWLLSHEGGMWKWEEVRSEEGDQPGARKGAVLAAWPGCGKEAGDAHCAVLFGGQRAGQALQDAYVLTLQSGAWRLVGAGGQLAAAREGGAALVVPGTSFLLLHGGCDMAKTACYNDVEALDLETGVWSKVSFDANMGVTPDAAEGARFVADAAADTFYYYGGCDPFSSTCSQRVLGLRPKAVCPGACEHGGEYRFEDGTCACDDAKFKGERCEEKLPPPPCPSDCSGHGECEEGECKCSGGWSAPDCTVFCPKDCSNNGRCEDKKCVCAEGFEGDDCGTRVCPRNCFDHGVCNGETGACECFAGYAGADCGRLDARCPSNCTADAGHGSCVAGVDGERACACLPGWGGEDCGTDVRCAGGLSETEACSGHGRCEAQACKCDDGWQGEACDKHRCPEDCSGHGECDVETGSCQCAAGFAGLDCTGGFNCDNMNLCSGHGVCTADDVCTCERGFTGQDCSLRTCPRGKAAGEGVEASECSNHGRCDGQLGRCTCEPTWGGEACDQQCPHRCSGHGACATNAAGRALCKCFRGFAGEACDEAVACPGGCSDHGTCFRGRCLCDPAYEGEDCSARRTCPGGCSGAGVCHNGKCVCAPGYHGADCGESDPCPNACSGAGVCAGGKCHCDPGAAGADCSEPVPCPRNCSGAGICDKGLCVCETGFKGHDCAQVDDVMTALLPQCPARCAEHGRCVAGRCFCSPGWGGEACDEAQESLCPRKCSGHGTCRFRKCFCAPGWEGDDCSYRTPCPADCSGHGRCDFGKCFCDAGFGGDDCATALPCANDCSDRGICLQGRCLCVPGFGGEDCSKATANFDFCPHACSGHGQCAIGRCFCDPGWEGKGCGKAVESPCPNDCSLNGVCKHGQCFCHPGFEGKDCSAARTCSEDCNAHGVCQYGQCYCQAGYRGQNCSEPVSSEELAAQEAGRSAATRHPDCPNACSQHGFCFNGRCQCEPGYAGEACERVTVGAEQCPNDCRGTSTAHDQPAKGLCALGRCFCYPGWAGEDCGLAVETPCPADCHGHGNCVYGRCSCDFGWQGASCADPAPRCVDNCNDHGLCQDGKCVCSKGFEGELCDRQVPLKCPNRCSGNGQCVFGRCWCAPGFEGPDCSLKASRAHTYAVNKPEPDYERALHNVEGVNYVEEVTEQQWQPLETPTRPDAHEVQAEADMASAHANDASGRKDAEFDTAREVGSPGATGGSPAQTAEAADLFKFRQASPCPGNCNDRGVCGSDGACTCDPQWAGAACDAPATCPGDCSRHGQCQHGQCFCDPGFEGADCARQVACPAGCSQRGVCSLGRCFCQPGFQGPDCSEAVTCKRGCSGRGTCAHGKCFCDPGFSGEDCGVAAASSCPAHCNSHGLCHNGKCYCVDGFSGPACEPIAAMHAAALAASAAGPRGVLNASTYTIIGGALVAVIAVAIVSMVWRYSRGQRQGRHSQELHAPLSTPAAF